MGLGPFDIIRAVTETKQQVVSPANEKEYNAFIVNRGLSYYPDCLFHAQAMNELPQIPGYMQFDYYLHILRKKKRWAKWNKKTKDENISALISYYDCSVTKAKEYLSVLSVEEMAEIRGWEDAKDK